MAHSSTSAPASSDHRPCLFITTLLVFDLVGRHALRTMLDTMAKATSQRDHAAEQALQRLRKAVHLVLNAVRMEQRSREYSSFSQTEKQSMVHDVEKRLPALEELVKAARNNHQLRPSPAAIAASHIHQKILDELYEDDFHATAESLLTDYTELREWFFDSPVFEKWQTGGSWYLHCFGEPRCGKSSFAAAVARWLRNKYAHDSKCAVISLFLGHGRDKTRYTSYHAILEAILRQLVEGKGKHDHHQDMLKELNTEHLKAMRQSPDVLQANVLRQMANFSKVFLIVDGLDDLATEGTLNRLKECFIGLLRNICATSTYEFRLMLVQARTDTKGPTDSQDALCDALGDSGKACGKICQGHYWRCEHCRDVFYVCHPCFGLKRYCLDRSHILKVDIDIHSEVSSYVDAKLNSMRSKTHFGRLMSGAMGISKHVQSVINQKAAGVFLIAKLYIDSLFEQQSIEEVLDVLDRLPTYQRLYYNSLMFEITAQPSADQDLALSAMAFVAATCNGDGVPMTFEELRGAMSLLTNRTDLDFTKAHLMECTKGLLRISDVVTPFHKTAGVFLEEECEDTLARHQADMAKLCLQAIKNSRETCSDTLVDKAHHLANPMQHLRDHPFVAYSLKTWAIYLRLANSRQAMQAGLTFLNQVYEQDLSIQQMMFLAMNKSGPNQLLWTGNTRLHVIAWLDLEATLREIQQKRDPTLNINAKDPTKGRTPLHLACIRRHSHIASRLLQMGADVSIKDLEDRTPLWEAVDNGDIAILRTLLESPSTEKETEQIRREQIQRALNDRNPRHACQTVLMLAIQNPDDDIRDEMVDMILQQPHLDFNLQNSAGRTALHFAASTGHIAGLTKLTKPGVRGVDFNVRDAAGRTPAIAAISSGKYFEVGVDHLVALLERVSKDPLFDVDAADNNGRSLLHFAATDEEYLPVVKFLTTAKAKVNKRDSHQRTSLHIAADSLAEADGDGVVGSLIKMGAELSATDEQGMTPYDLAAQKDASWKDAVLPKGHTMQQRGYVIPWKDAFDNPEEFFDKISDLPGEVMGQADPTGFTLLHCAVYTKQLAAVKFLLHEKGVDINAQDQAYQTPLHVALQPHDGIDPSLDMVQLLLAQGVGIDVNIANAQGRSPLECAFDTNELDLQCDLAMALIRKGAHIVLAKVMLQQVMDYAIGHDDLEAVEALLKGGASLFLYCRAGLLPSETAAEDKASEQMIELLKKRENEVLTRIVDG